MSESTTNVTAYFQVPLEQRQATLAARVAKGEPLLHKQVRVLIGSVPADSGMVGELLQIDSTDHTMTFRVAKPDVSESAFSWVYDIEDAASPPAEPTPEPTTRFSVGELVTQSNTAYRPLVVAMVVGVLPDPERVQMVGREENQSIWQFRTVGATDRLAHLDESSDLLPPTLSEVTQVLVDRTTLMERQLEQARTNASSQMAALSDFQQQVREVAIRVAGENSWCDDGLNRVLDELGLDRKTTEYEVTVSLVARQTVTVTIEADSEDDAREQAFENYSDEIEHNLYAPDWEIDWDESDVDEVTQA